MPFQNEHAARLNDPGKYVRFRRENNAFGSGVDAVYGIPRSGGGVELQAIRFGREKFTPTQARAWLKDHDYKPVLFEEAKEEKGLSKLLSLLKGGPGSGNFGHAGRPGEVGGSSEGGGGFNQDKILDSLGSKGYGHVGGKFYVVDHLSGDPKSFKNSKSLKNYNKRLQRLGERGS